MTLRIIKSVHSLRAFGKTEEAYFEFGCEIFQERIAGSIEKASLNIQPGLTWRAISNFHASACVVCDGDEILLWYHGMQTQNRLRQQENYNQKCCAPQGNQPISPRGRQNIFGFSIEPIGAGKGGDDKKPHQVGMQNRMKGKISSLIKQKPVFKKPFKNCSHLN
jgi:hypothetical protein